MAPSINETFSKNNSENIYRNIVCEKIGQKMAPFFFANGTSATQVVASRKELSATATPSGVPSVAAAVSPTRWRLAHSAHSAQEEKPSPWYAEQ